MPKCTLQERICIYWHICCDYKGGHTGQPSRVQHLAVATIVAGNQIFIHLPTGFCHLHSGAQLDLISLKTPQMRLQPSNITALPTLKSVNWAKLYMDLP